MPEVFSCFTYVNSVNSGTCHNSLRLFPSLFDGGGNRGTEWWSWSRNVCPSAQATAAKCRRPRNLHTREVCPRRLEAGSPRSRRGQGWFLRRPLSLASKWLFSPCVLTCYFLSAPSLPGSLPLLSRTLVLSDRGPTLVTSFNLNDPLNAPSPNAVMLGVRASPYELGGHNPVPSGPPHSVLQIRGSYTPSPTPRQFSLHLNFIPYKGTAVMLSI